MVFVWSLIDGQQQQFRALLDHKKIPSVYPWLWDSAFLIKLEFGSVDLDENQQQTQPTIMPGLWFKPTRNSVSFHYQTPQMCSIILFCMPYCVVPENIHTHPMEGQRKFPRGGGLKSQNFKRNVWGLTGISWGVGESNQKSLRGRGMDIIWNNTFSTHLSVSKCVLKLINNSSC